MIAMDINKFIWDYGTRINKGKIKSNFKVCDVYNDNNSLLISNNELVIIIESTYSIELIQIKNKNLIYNFTIDTQYDIWEKLIRDLFVKYIREDKINSLIYDR